MNNLLFKTYVPKSFCREFVEIKGSSLQLGMYMALVLGHKPLMDDWIPKEKISEFKKICHKYKILIKEDVLFENIDKDTLPINIIGRECLTTTSAYAFPVGSNVNASVHIFLSKRKSLLNKGMWYPVIIKDRVIFQPRADSLQYGYVLGYPGCCIKFFRQFNHWVKYSYLFEAYKNTRGRPVFLCNPFLKDTSYSYIYHMPCSFNCKKTSQLIANLRKDILKREPGFVETTDKYLKLPFLVFYEKKFYCFDGVLEGDFLRYKKAFFCSQIDANNVYENEFKNADALKLQGRRIILYRRNKVMKILDVPLGNFAPEYPFLIRFH